MVAGGIAADITAIGWLRAVYRGIDNGRTHPPVMAGKMKKRDPCTRT
jgi:hypothetical protein